MPNIKVRALDLRDMTAILLLQADTSISIQRLNYIWVRVRDVLTGVETQLRFRIADRRLMLRGTPRLPLVVEKFEAEFKQALDEEPDELQWHATMVHYPIPGVGQINSCVITVGDSLQVDVFGPWDEFWVKPKVTFGEVTEIILAVS